MEEVDVMAAEQATHSGRPVGGRGDRGMAPVPGVQGGAGNPQRTHAAYERHGARVMSRAGAAIQPHIARTASHATVTTVDGRDIVDLASGSFGYSHPRILAAVAGQLAVMPLSARLFLSRPLARLVQYLAEVTPGDLAVTYPCNSSTEAMEGALKLAMGLRRSRRRVIAMAGSCHGTTLGALGISAGTHPRMAARLPIRACFIPFGDIAALRQALHDERSSAVVLEPWSCGAGLDVPPPGYLTAVRKLCDESGALMIVNESITGLGRTGRLFAVDSEDVVPDIIVIGGALGGGVMPVGAYVTTREINARVYGRSGPWMHGSTTGGNPLACTAAVAALDVIESDDIPGTCRANGARVMAALRSMHVENPLLTTGVSGAGYLAALGLRDHVTAAAVARRALVRGALTRVEVTPGGRASIGIRPPLIATAEELDRGLESIALALEDVAAKCA